MSVEKFDEQCLGCRPAMLDIRTGKLLPDTDPIMVKVLQLWSEQTKETKEAWHKITCQDSKNPFDRRLVGEFLGKFSQLILDPNKISN